MSQPPFQPTRSDLQGEAGMLAVYDWPLPDVTPGLGTVLLVHGLGEHAGRYGELAAQLRSWGFIVRAYDQQGHGQSEGARGDMLHPGSLQADLGRVIDATRQHPHSANLPLVLLGHSMGGLVVARALAEQLRPVDAAVLSSPALGASPNVLQKLLLATLPKLAPHLCVDNGLDANFVARDAAEVQAYKADPRVHRRISIGLAAWILSQGTRTVEEAARWSVPTLLLYAGDDHLVQAGASAAFARSAPAEVVQAHCFEAMYHEIFHDPEREQVYSLLKPWLLARFSA
ncbi:alpha/beta hydrolase [Limnohabitans planktonicus]|uniref:Alpha/beta hydrolase n=1 Tax=Limnohabitans planktonicus II-D5 TaxID=1293045 RepID=A0A2T7UBJ9_9BURK|nr:alpha/beta hydrolase [Limnohabitans planktonicus]PVE42024.1 alpha/beta hydrolase [Limnohabitans planktonicus II-D5]